MAAITGQEVPANSKDNKQVANCKNVQVVGSVRKKREKKQHQEENDSYDPTGDRQYTPPEITN